MFLNDNISVMKTDEMYLLFNFSNGIVAGVDSQAIEFLKRVKNYQLNCNDLTDEEKEFFAYLVENDFISDVEFKNEQTPITAYLHLTNKCNLHCVGCYSFDERRNRCEDLSTEEILNAIDQLSDVGIQNLVFSGGEPLLRRLCHNKQLINSHFYRGVSELPYKLLFAVIYTHLEFRYEVSHTITSHHVHHFHQTRIPDGTLLDYMVQYRKPLFPQFFLYPKKFLPENNPHHKEFHLRPYIQNNANQ
ncbi:hypothetical protein BSR19_11255 (plasmid) [Streptococcus salivarius]|uniref:Radical SAM core domain-containing protein n=1 Tax=Streptococcus salivarius TaxID=1304 RepID=A0AB37DDF9_STRSL|nr:hypothetical protein BSR19_11255 [Streptococcus salivarius]